jgi:prephenate dehydrogenase
MNDPDFPPDDFAETVAIVGVGLIGGSIAAALKTRGFDGRIWGVGRNAQRLAAAQSAGLIDAFAENVSEMAADLWIFCTPVDRIVSGVLAVRGQVGRSTLVTDAGSVKREICEGIQGKLPAGVEFIGSHPLAGSEQRGFEHADAELFAGRLCLLTPEKSTSKEQLSRLRGFWKYLGMRLVEMDAADHDRALAETSHLPHLIASALAATLDENNAHLAATGFADTTRIAAGDPELWTAIFLQNAEGVSGALSRFTDQLTAFREALNRRDEQTLHHLLKLAKTKRDNLASVGRQPQDFRIENLESPW